MKFFKKAALLALAGVVISTQLVFAGSIDTVSKGGQVMVPLKEAVSSLKATMSYNADAKKITVKNNGKAFEFWVGKAYFRAAGKSLNLESPVEIIKNRAYVPLHVIEQIGGVDASVANGKLVLGKEETTPLRIGTITGPTGIAMAKLIDDSYLGENAKVTYDMEANAQLLPAKLLKKELDIAFVPTNMAAIVYNKSKGDVVLLSTNIWGLLSVVTTDPNVKTWNDLKGKQIDIFGQGATPEIAFKALAEDHKLDIKKDLQYKMAYDTPATLVAAMASGNTKDGIAVLAEPFTSMVLAKNKNARVLFDVQTEWKKSYNLGFPMSSLVVRKAYLEEHPEIVAAFVREFSYNLTYANANPKVMGELVRKMPELPFEADVVASSIPRSDFKYVSAESAKPALEKYLKVLYDFDPQTVGGKLPAGDFYAKTPKSH